MRPHDVPEALQPHTQGPGAHGHAVVQAYDGPAWVTRETPEDPRAALEAYLARRRLNLGLYRGGRGEGRHRAFQHPEYGEMSVDWILRTLAGHDLHHLRHLEAVREPGGGRVADSAG